MADEEQQETKKEYQLKSEHSYKIVTSYMQQAFEEHAAQIAIVAVDKFKHLKDIALYIKQSYDKKYPGGPQKQVTMRVCQEAHGLAHWIGWR